MTLEPRLLTVDALDYSRHAVPHLGEQPLRLALHRLRHLRILSFGLFWCWHVFTFIVGAHLRNPLPAIIRRRAFQDYIDGIVPTLSAAEQNRLRSYLASSLGIKPSTMSQTEFNATLTLLNMAI